MRRGKLYVSREKCIDVRNVDNINQRNKNTGVGKESEREAKWND